AAYTASGTSCTTAVATTGAGGSSWRAITTTTGSSSPIQQRGETRTDGLALSIATTTTRACRPASRAIAAANTTASATSPNATTTRRSSTVIAAPSCWSRACRTGTSTRVISTPSSTSSRIAGCMSSTCSGSGTTPGPTARWAPAATTRTSCCGGGTAG